MLHSQPIKGSSRELFQQGNGKGITQNQNQNQNQEQIQKQGQGGQVQVQDGQVQVQGHLMSPTQGQSPFISSNADQTMAILSPPASRYAFDPNSSNNNSGYNQLDNILSPLLATVTSPVNDLNFANLNLSIVSSPLPGYGVEHDIPAFQPQTEQLLQNYTNDLQLFNNWIKKLNIEEQKTAIGLFIDSIKSKDVIEFITDKISTAVELEDASKRVAFSPPLSANTTLPHHLRPVSPILSINSNKLANSVPITLDSILNDTSDLYTSNNSNSKKDNNSNNTNSNHNTNTNNNTNNNNNNNNNTNNTNNSTNSTNTNNDNVIMNHSDNILYRPAPRRVLSPQPPSQTQQQLNLPNIIKTGLNNIIEPIERPKSAGPIYNNFNGTMSPIYPNNQLNSNMGLYDGINENSLSLDTKLQYSLNTINNRSMLDSHKGNTTNNNNGNKEERGRHRNLQNRNMNGFLPNLNMTMNHCNSINGSLNMSGMNNNNNNNNNNGSIHSYNNNYNHLKGYTQSSSVPPNNRIRSNKGGLNNVNMGMSMSMNTNMNTNTTSTATTINNNKNKNTSMNMNVITNNHENASNVLANTESTSSTSSNCNLPKDITSEALLEDIPAWLKVLRLHKYTDKLQHLEWKKMVEMDDAALEALGVGTVGARNKLLKSFKYVKDFYGM